MSRDGRRTRDHRSAGSGRCHSREVKSRAEPAEGPRVGAGGRVARNAVVLRGARERE